MGLTDAFFRDRGAVRQLTWKLWAEVETGFRSDEQHVERAAFDEQIGALQPQLESLPAGQVPDGALAFRLLQALAAAIPERIAGLHDRIDDLNATCQARDRELMTVKLAASWQTDELERCRTMLMKALRGRETVLPSTGADGTAPLVTQLLAAFLDISAPPPRPEASLGRRATTAALAAPAKERSAPKPLDPAAGERAIIVQVLREVLDGTAQVPRLVRALEDPEVAKRLAELAAEHRTYRGILQQIGVLPKE